MSHSNFLDALMQREQPSPSPPVIRRDLIAFSTEAVGQTEVVSNAEAKSEAQRYVQSTKCSNSVMVGIDVKPDPTFMDNVRVNKLNNLVATAQAIVCDRISSSPGFVDQRIDLMFPGPPDMEIIPGGCNALLRNNRELFERYTSTSAGNFKGEREALLPLTAAGFDMIQDMVKSTCVNDKLTKAHLKTAVGALAKVVCNV